ncbi:MAG: methyltransferase domain-containing protein [Anaerolineae bacterium]|nr:methyltransferase domain-containing protein [Anaerolineae bacterium]
MTNIFALTVRGLESVCAEEMAALPGVAIAETAYRRVAATGDGALDALLRLRTVDDLYLDAGTWTGIGHTRDMLAVLQWHAAQLELDAIAGQIASVRPLPPQPVFSITASFVGRRNYTTDEIKRTIAEGILSLYDWRYTPDDREADLNVRLFIEHETAYVGVRLGKHPLHERAYKAVERPGSLKPTVAAAMLRLAGADPGARLLDPCCGSGTIVIEGALLGAAAQGGDIDPEAVEAALANASAAGVEVAITQRDARVLPLPDRSIDCVVTNLPWGRQIAVDDALAGLYADVCSEIERVIAPGGRIVVLTSAPDYLVFRRLRQTGAVEISLFGQTPAICTFAE